MFDYLTTFQVKCRILLIVFMFTFIFPVVNILILYSLKRIPAITLSNQRDRTFPYLVTALFYFGLFYLMLDMNIWTILKISVIGAGFAILMTALVNLKFKISAHMVGIGGLLGVLLCVSYLIKFDMTPFYILVIILAGLLGFARLKLEEHKPYQIYSGFLMGLVAQVVMFFLLQKIVYT